jgi:hypothetical protein
VEQTEDHERHGGRNFSGPERELHHFYRLNLLPCATRISAEPCLHEGDVHGRRGLRLPLPGRGMHGRTPVSAWLRSSHPLETRSVATKSDANETQQRLGLGDKPSQIEGRNVIALGRFAHVLAAFIEFKAVDPRLDRWPLLMRLSARGGHEDQHVRNR